LLAVLARFADRTGTGQRGQLIWWNDGEMRVATAAGSPEISLPPLALVERTRASYDALLREKGYGTVTTELAPADGLPFYYAEPFHQQYLYKVPNGYDCHAETGLALPPL